MKIRPIAEKDWTTLKNIVQAQEHFRPAEIRVALEIIDYALKQQREEDYIIRLVEGEDHEVLGYVCYGKAPLTDAVYDLYWIIVHPAYQNQGAGSFLLNYAQQDLRRRQARLLLIETSSLPAYAKPRAFYAKHGFQEIARIKDYYEQGDDKIIFGKVLNSQ
ncbi:MAG: GNAT family N-acetyltransferase [Thermodesulfobacteriota bacterium]